MNNGNPSRIGRRLRRSGSEGGPPGSHRAGLAYSGARRAAWNLPLPDRLRDMQFTRLHLAVGGAAALVVAIGASIVLGNLPGGGGAGEGADDAALLYNDGRALPADFADAHPSLVERIHAELEARYGITADQLYDEDARPDGYRVVLTLDRALQDAAEETSGEAGVVAVEPGTGAVLCYYGAEAETGADLVGSAAPQPSSSVFDMITAATALESGASIDSWWSDDDVDVTLAEAVQQNRDGAMDTMAGEYGADTVLATANGMGLTAMADADGTLRDLAAGDYDGLDPAGLGTYPVPVIDMAGVYATIAAGGEYAETHLVDAVLDSGGGQIRAQQDLRTNRAIAETTAQDLQFIGLGEADAMEDRDFFGIGADFHGSTTQSWYVGAIPQLSVAAWANGSAAADGGMPLWRNVIDTAIETKGYEAERLPGASGEGEDLTDGIEDDGSMDPDGEYCRAHPDEAACAASQSPTEAESSSEAEETSEEPEPEPTTSSEPEPEPTTSSPEETTSEECTSWPFC
ncbi:penicillin-binding transpeptidase domain-containing protein [Glycomyces mayteni]|uniref:penicillin-binding transpeptidase domain-containing protein n=1 Tax=Glycomyces mayteni TaxID=543887 RepID=UPI00361C844F